MPKQFHLDKVGVNVILTRCRRGDKSSVATSCRSRCELSVAIDAIWSTLRRERPEANLIRVGDYLDVMMGLLKPPRDTEDRALYGRFFFPGLKAGPYYEPSDLGLMLSDSTFAAVRSDCEAAFSGSGLVEDHSDLVSGGAWNCVYLKREYEWVEEPDFRFADTVRFLRDQRVATEALFSRLLPGTTIERHSDRANYVTTIHVPIRAGSSWLSVGGERRSYVVGAPICFDSTFYHEVKCNSGDPRDVLLYNVWHPELSDDEVWAIAKIRDLWNLNAEFDPNLGVQGDCAQGCCLEGGARCAVAREGRG